MGDIGRHTIHPPVWLLLHLAAAVALDRWLPLARLIPPPWTRLGLVPGLCGAAIVLWCVILFRRRGTPILPFTESTALVLVGPYRFSRNPIYVGLTLLLVCAALSMGSASPWIAVASFWLILRQRFVLREEALLRARFGAPYDSFCDRVRRWL